MPHIFSGPQGFTEISPKTSEEARRVAALLDAIRDPAGEKDIEKFDRIFKPRLAKVWNLSLEDHKS